jgi:type VII secretion protein EccE
MVLRRRRRPDHLGSIHVVQLLLVQAVLVAVSLVLSRNVLVAGLAAAVGLLLLLLMATRYRGRWWLERLRMTRQYRLRRRGVPVDRGADARLQALRHLAPGLCVENQATSTGGRVGVARDGFGWFAVVAVTATGPTRGVPGGLPLDALVGALVEVDQPGAVLQVVTQTVPAPGIGSSPGSPASESYRQLLAMLGSTPIPADRATWIAVRLDAWSLAETLPDRGTAGQVAPAVVATLIRSVVRQLRQASVSHRLLDATELLDVLALSCDLDPAGQGTGVLAPREEWSVWHSLRLTHRCFWIREWPPVEQAAAVLDWVASAPAAATTVSLVLTPDRTGDLIDLRGLVRVAGPANQLPALCQLVVRHAQRARADLFPLDGEQGPAVYASAPTGGGAR